MSNYPNKFMIPEDRIPRAFAQGVIRSCVAVAITKILEVINYVKTKEFIKYSKGYTYARHNCYNNGGMEYEYALDSLLQRGTVPLDMHSDYDEMPDLRDRLYASPDFEKLEKEAEKTKIKSWVKIPGNAYKFETIKKYLYEHQMPLLANLSGDVRHGVVIVGWDGDKLLWQDHDGTPTVRTIDQKKINVAYYIDGGIEDYEKEEKVPEINFIDVKEDRWSYEAIKYVSEKGIMKGTASNVFDPAKPLTREEMATIIYRLFNKEYI